VFGRLQYFDDFSEYFPRAQSNFWKPPRKVYELQVLYMSVSSPSISR
jgi:hypothetical protein